jgi:hypothetical protein
LISFNPLCLRVRHIDNDMRNSKQIALVGAGVSLGNYEACDLYAKHFPLVVHIWHPRQAGHCQSVGKTGLTVEWLEGELLTLPELDRIARYAGQPGNLLVHCAAGLGRSPTLAVLCLAARQVHPPVALQLIAAAMWDQYAHPRAPNLLSGPATQVFRHADMWTGKTGYWDD